MADKPEYRVYRASRGWLSRLLYRERDRKRFEPPGSPGSSNGVAPPRAAPPTLDKPAERLRPPREPRERPGLLEPELPRRRRWPLHKPFTVGRVLRFVVVFLLSWTALTIALFMISSAREADNTPERVKRALDDGGNMLTSANNILVLGSDKRRGESGRGRADTIMLMRYGGGKASRLSIPRDTLVDIPGHGPSKINAAYAFGGPALMIQTVKQFLGVEVNHVVEVDFEGFPDFVDALGGVKMKFDTCIVSRFEGRTPRIGCEGNFRRCRATDGKVKLDGQDALDVVRIRKNVCAPEESDLTRARRQQKFLEAVKGRIFSPRAFPRWPWAAWKAPQAIRTDMAGPALMALFFDSEIGGTLEPAILRPVDPGANPLVVSDAEKQAAVEKFLDG